MIPLCNIHGPSWITSVLKEPNKISNTNLNVEINIQQEREVHHLSMFYKNVNTVAQSCVEITIYHTITFHHINMYLNASFCS
jgi:hypothetical protein